jgi:alpha-glucosidase
MALVATAGHAEDLTDDNRSLASPDGRITVSVFLEEGVLSYAVRLEGEDLLSGNLGIRLEGETGDFSAGLSVKGVTDARIDETYVMPVGKRRQCLNRANEKTVALENAAGGRLEVGVRAYDDGIAWRYAVGGEGKALVQGEVPGTFKEARPVARWAQNLHRTGGYSYERAYGRFPADQRIARGVGFPVLSETETGWVLMTEAAVYEQHAGSRLQQGAKGFDIVFCDPPGPIELPWTSPWRVAVIGKTPKAIVESVLVQNLNPPCALEETDWIEPGVATFPWLTDHDANMSEEKLRGFIDMAAEMGWRWLEFDIPLVHGHSILALPPERWMAEAWVPKVVEYAASKGLKVYTWDHVDNLDTPEECARILDWCVKHGVKGIKVDFLHSDSQERFGHRTRIIEECAKRRMMVSFHGSTIPRGQQRRWPHVATYESVLGEEFYTFRWGSARPTPAHNVSLVYTRNVIGSMDYTPTTFRVTSRRKPRSTTAAHETALAVAFESGWQCVSVSPAGLEDHPARGFLKSLPSAWDDTRFLAGRPEAYAVLARRKGETWYVAGINTEEARSVKVPLDFLPEGKAYAARIYRDGEPVEDPFMAELVVEKKACDRATTLDLRMLSGGGFGIILEVEAGEPGK